MAQGENLWLCKFVLCVTYRGPYKHVNLSLTQFLGVGLGSFPTMLMEKLSASEKAHSLSIITQQVQGKDGIRASKAQRQTAWPHHSVHPEFGNWVKTIKREHVIETLQCKLWTQVSTESHFMGERYMMSCVEDRAWDLEWEGMYLSSLLDHFLCNFVPSQLNFLSLQLLISNIIKPTLRTSEKFNNMYMK